MINGTKNAPVIISPEYLNSLSAKKRILAELALEIGMFQLEKPLKEAVGNE
jgi:hypothetical protein